MSSNDLVRRETEDDKLARGATLLDDMDLLLSPIDGALVVVPQHRGIHVCQTCVKPVNFQNGVEAHLGFARQLFHPQCVGGKPKTIWSVIKQVVGFRRVSKILGASKGIDAAQAETSGKIVSS